MTYPDYIEYQQLLTEDEINKLYKITDFNNDKLETAGIYKQYEGINDIDKDIRNCKEYRLENLVLKWINNKITPKLNQNNIDYQFELLDNYSRIVSYQKGEYFKKHTDVINIKSNHFISYSLLICLEPCEEGGDTTLYLDKDIEINSKNTSQIKGGGIIFKKSILHEGKPVIKGNKVILFASYKCYLNTDNLIVYTDTNYKCLSINILKNIIDNRYYQYYISEKNKYLTKNLFHYKVSKIEYDRLLRDEYIQKKEIMNIIPEDIYKYIYSYLDLKSIIPLKQEEYNMIKECLPKNKELTTYDLDMVYIDSRIYINSLYIDDILVFSHPNAIYHKSGDFIDAIGGMMNYNKLDEYYEEDIYQINDNQFLDEIVENKNTDKAEQPIYVFGDNDLHISTYAMTKLYHKYISNNEIDNKIYQYFKDMTQEEKVSISSNDNIRDYDMESVLEYDSEEDEYISIREPQYMYTNYNNNILKDQFNINLLNACINVNDIKNDNIDKFQYRLFDIIKDLEETMATDIIEESIPAYYGKTTYEFMYEEVNKKGLINLSKYKYE